MSNNSSQNDIDNKNEIEVSDSAKENEKEKEEENKIENESENKSENAENNNEAGDVINGQENLSVESEVEPEKDAGEVSVEAEKPNEIPEEEKTEVSETEKEQEINTETEEKAEEKTKNNDKAAEKDGEYMIRYEMGRATAKKIPNTANILKTAVILGLLTVVTVLMLAVLDNITAPTIQERQNEDKAQAVEVLFGDNIEIAAFDGELSFPVEEILYITNKSDGALIGYCIHTLPRGFNGIINMLVAVNPDGKVMGISILEMSETAGMGTQIQEDSFLGQFKGKGGTISVNVIAGATISSKAVLNGVNAALMELESAKITQHDLGGVDVDEQ